MPSQVLITADVCMRLTVIVGLEMTNSCPKLIKVFVCVYVCLFVYVDLYGSDAAGVWKVLRPVPLGAFLLHHRLDAALRKRPEGYVQEQIQKQGLRRNLL